MTENKSTAENSSIDNSTPMKSGKKYEFQVSGFITYLYEIDTPSDDWKKHELILQNKDESFKRAVPLKDMQIDKDTGWLIVNIPSPPKKHQQDKFDLFSDPKDDEPPILIFEDYEYADLFDIEPISEELEESNETK